MVKEIYNELHKAIDEYWQSKYQTFAKGRIKLRGRYCAAYVWLLLNEPTPRLLGPVPTVTSLHSSHFSHLK